MSAVPEHYSINNFGCATSIRRFHFKLSLLFSASKQKHTNSSAMSRYNRTIRIEMCSHSTDIPFGAISTH